MNPKYLDAKIYNNKILAIQFVDNDDTSWEYYSVKKIKSFQEDPK